MTTKHGNVLGCVGGLGKKTTARSFNRATQSVRQTGSSIKPIAVVAPAIDKKVITGATILDDTEKDFANNYHPTDYNEKSLGNITVRRAIESSQNIPFVEIMEDLKPKTAINYLKKMGITTLTEKDNGLPLALGGLEKGISPLQMAGAYATIANDGKYIEPTFYTKIERKNGSVIIKAKQTTRRAFSKETAYILKEMLTQPVQGQNGTATYCKITGVDVAAKTGTTDENYDRWLCGFTPYYTAVTWYGFDINESINFNQRNPAGLLWANVMSRVHTGLNSAKFEKPASVTGVTICAETGKKATTGCQNKYVEYFLAFTAPKELCSKHSGKEIDTNSTNDSKKNVTEIVKGITEDIDAKEPVPTIESPTNTTNTNTTSTENNTQKTNNSTSNKTNSTTNTNTNNNTNTQTSNTNKTNNTNSNSTNTTNNISSDDTRIDNTTE